MPDLKELRDQILIIVTQMQRNDMKIQVAEADNLKLEKELIRLGEELQKLPQPEQVEVRNVAWVELRPIR